jgi:LPXTG-motif cell wall-anchored protein
VAANNYELRVAGPWRPRNDTFQRVGVFASDRADSLLYPMLPGPTQPDLDGPRPPVSVPPSPPPPPPTPQASPRPANLADTGASVVELSALGLLLVAAGTVLLFVRRRPVS